MIYFLINIFFIGNLLAEFTYKNLSVKTDSALIFSEADTSSNSEYTYTKLQSKKDGHVLKIYYSENVSKEKAVKEVKKRINSIKLQYVSLLSPYTGAISKTVECKNVDFKIENFKSTINQISSTVSFKIGSGFVFGECQKDKLAYNAFISYNYCLKTKELYEVRYFYPNMFKFNKSNDFSLCKN